MDLPRRFEHILLVVEVDMEWARDGGIWIGGLVG